jgi:hypothetical protein
MGCIADHFMPDFADEFGRKYPTYWGDFEKPFDAYYNSEIGNLALALNFGLKDSITNVVKMQNFLISIKTPADVLSESNSKNLTFRTKYFEIKKKYDELIEKALENVFGKIIFFEYSGELSISSDIANRLSFLYPKKYIAIFYKKGNIINVSLRGKNVKQILDKILKQINNASGGGHDDAVGARISSEDLERFKTILKSEIK